MSGGGESPAASLPAAAARVQEVLDNRAGAPGRFTVRELDASTRTAGEAATALGCTVGQIAKSLIFKAGDGRAVLVIASGDNQVDTSKVAAVLGQAVGRADAAFVRESTGFAIGGVPPVGHANPPIVLLDQDLRRHERIWAAAGTPRSVFALTPGDLPALTGASFRDIAA